MPGVMRKPRRSPAFTHLVITLFGVGAGLCRFLPSLFRSRSALIAENLFLRKQLAFYRERDIEPRRLTDAARICLVVWSRLFNWREALMIVKPETLIGWHCKGFRVKGGVKPDHWGGVKVDQRGWQEIRDCRGGGRLERRPAPPARQRVSAGAEDVLLPEALSSGRRSRVRSSIVGRVCVCFA